MVYPAVVNCLFSSTFPTIVAPVFLTYKVKHIKMSQMPVTRV